MLDPRLLLAGSLLLLGAGPGCLQPRNPVGGCPHEDRQLAEHDATPWGTLVRDDLAQLAGPYSGTLEWLDGDDAINVPKAGERIDVEVMFALDSSSVVLREFVHDDDRVAACEPDELFLAADVSIVRLDDGEVELEFPLRIERTTESPQYYGEALISPPEDLVAGLEPVTDFDSQGVIARFWWEPDGTNVRGTWTYSGQSSSGQSGQGATRDIAVFAP